MSDRNHFIDVAKGFGILLVVLGHNPLVLQPKSELFNVIFSFHMLLFFFLSGVLFKPGKSFTCTFKEKFDALLKPYFVTLILHDTVKILGNNGDILPYLYRMLYGNGDSVRWVPLWFLTHLFIVSLFS